MGMRAKAAAGKRRTLFRIRLWEIHVVPIDVGARRLVSDQNSNSHDGEQRRTATPFPSR